MTPESQQPVGAAAAPLIYGRMVKIIKECGPIAKSSRNQQQSYNFRGIDAVYNELHEVFADSDVFVLPTVISEVREERPTKAGGAMTYTIMRVNFRFVTIDGSFVECTTTGEASDSGDKSCNKAMSTAMKYALFMVFLIPTEGDHDTENHSPEFAARPQQATTQQQPQQKAATTAPKKTDEELRTGWQKYIDGASSPEDINRSLQGLATSNLFAELGPRIGERAKALGLIYDEKANVYVTPKATSTPAHA